MKNQFNFDTINVGVISGVVYINRIERAIEEAVGWKISTSEILSYEKKGATVKAKIQLKLVNRIKKDTVDMYDLLEKLKVWSVDGINSIEIVPKEDWYYEKNNFKIW